MPLVAAIESDRDQARCVAEIVRDRLGAELVIGHSAAAALRALGDRVPDVILTSSLLAAADETTLFARLRELGPAAAHVRTLAVPILASARADAPAWGLRLGRRRDRQEPSPDGCDPAAFADQVQLYLDRAAQEREAAATRAAALPPTTATSSAAGTPAPTAATTDATAATPALEPATPAASVASVDHAEPTATPEEPHPPPPAPADHASPAADRRGRAFPGSRQKHATATPETSEQEGPPAAAARAAALDEVWPTDILGLRDRRRPGPDDLAPPAQHDPPDQVAETAETEARDARGLPPIDLEAAPASGPDGPPDADPGLAASTPATVDAPPGEGDAPPASADAASTPGADSWIEIDLDGLASSEEAACPVLPPVVDRPDAAPDVPEGAPICDPVVTAAPDDAVEVAPAAEPDDVPGPPEIVTASSPPLEPPWVAPSAVAPPAVAPEPEVVAPPDAAATLDLSASSPPTAAPVSREAEPPDPEPVIPGALDSSAVPQRAPAPSAGAPAGTATDPDDQWAYFDPTQSRFKALIRRLDEVAAEFRAGNGA